MGLCDVITVRSLGLALAPRIRFLSKAQRQRSVAVQNDSSDESEDELKSFKAQLKGEQAESEEDDSDDEEEERKKFATLLCGSDDKEDDQEDLEFLRVKSKDVFSVNVNSESKEVNAH